MLNKRQSPPLVPCPTCQKHSPFSPANRWRPFCSERCKTLDLGAWASERYVIADAPDAPGPDGTAVPQQEPDPAATMPPLPDWPPRQRH